MYECSCGGVNYYPHELGMRGCYRKQALGHLVPVNFRTDESGREMCDVNGYTITTYTLYQQRMYNFDGKIWSLLKNEESINSLDVD